MNRRAAGRIARAAFAVMGSLLLAGVVLQAWRAPGHVADWLLAASLCG